MPASRLPVLPSPPPDRGVRPSRAARWRAGTLVAVHLAIAAHVAHWLIAGRTVTPVEPSEAMAFSKAGIVNAGLIFFALAILLTAVFGRFFCGWACHLVALQDLCRWLLGKIGIRPRPLRSRLLAWVPALAFVYMFLWPAAYRLWSGDTLGVRGSELTTEHFWETFPGWVVAVLTLLVCGFACVYFLGSKGFCTYACPYGAIFAAAERLAPLRVRVTDACSGCGHCTAACSSNVRVHEEVATWGMVVDSGCMRCGDCVSVCPNDALHFGFGRLPLAASARQPPATRRPALGWGEELLAGVAFLAVFLAFRGLYGHVPFLLSLGLAGIGAFLALMALRLARRPDFAWRHHRLKIAGRLTAAGRLAVATLALCAAFWAHGAWLRLESALGERSYRALGPERHALVDVTRPVPRPRVAARTHVVDARARYERLERWGALPWRGAAPRLAALRYLDGDRVGAGAAARLAVARGEERYDSLRLLARVAAETGDPDAAAAAGEQAIALAPDRQEGYAALAILLAQAGDLPAAAALLERARLRFPGSAQLAYDSGVLAAYRGDLSGAIGHFRRALVLDPGHREAQENLAGMLAAAGRLAEAAEEYRRALARTPGDAELRVLLARSLAGAGMVEEAGEELAAVLALTPGHADARALLQTITMGPAGVAGGGGNKPPSSGGERRR